MQNSWMPMDIFPVTSVTLCQSQRNDSFQDGLEEILTSFWRNGDGREGWERSTVDAAGSDISEAEINRRGAAVLEGRCYYTYSIAYIILSDVQCLSLIGWITKAES